jgi:acetyl esterase/lipase
MDIAYTKPPNSQLEGMVADVNRAIAWMKTEGARLGVNPERIVLMGCSSGAQMALLAAYAPHEPAFKPVEVDVDTSVRGVVSFSGQTDMLAAYEYFERNLPPFLTGRIPLERWIQSVIEWVFQHSRLRKEGSYVDPLQMLPSVLGGTPDEVPERYYLGSPVNHIGPHCPPTLLFQGTHDYTGLLPHVRRMHTALRNAGATSIYVEFPNCEHAFEFGMSPWSPPAQAATYDTERFLALLT